MKYNNISVTKNATQDKYLITIENFSTLVSKQELEQLAVMVNNALTLDYESGLIEPDPVTNVKILSMSGSLDA